MRISSKIAFSVVALLMVPGICFCAESNDVSVLEDFAYEDVVEPAIESQNSTSSVQLELIKNNRHYVIITAGLLAFSLVVISYLMKITPHQARDLVTVIGLVSVIFGSLLLVLVVDTTEALTAPMGILGAIAGYLFGTAQRKDDSSESTGVMKTDASVAH